MIKLSGKIEFVVTEPSSFIVMEKCARRGDMVINTSRYHDGMCNIVRELIGQDVNGEPVTARSFAIVYSATDDPTQWKQHWMSLDDYYQGLTDLGMNNGGG